MKLPPRLSFAVAWFLFGAGCVVEHRSMNGGLFLALAAIFVLESGR